MTKGEKILGYLQSIEPERATISQIESQADVHPHQQVYQITQKLLRADMERDFMMDESDLIHLVRWVHATMAYWDRAKTIKPPPGALQQAIEVLVKLFAQNFP